MKKYTGNGYHVALKNLYMSDNKELAFIKGKVYYFKNEGTTSETKCKNTHWIFDDGSSGDWAKHFAYVGHIANTQENPEGLYHVPLNLEEGLIHTGREKVSNTVCAIYHKHKNILIVRPEYRYQIDSIVAKADEILGRRPEVRYGDCFQVDTWDKKIQNLEKLESQTDEL